MSEDRETSETIDLVAAEWAARADRGPLSSDDEARLKVWLAGDIRRQGAYIRARAVSARSERAGALGVSYSGRALNHDVDWNRRRLLAVGGGALAAAGAGAAVVVWGRAPGEAYASTLGEVRRISLPDGSYVVLNSSSRIEAFFEREQRRVEVKAGAALFETVETAARPFIIVAEGIEIAASAAVLSLDVEIGRPMRLTVSEGEARVRSRGIGRVLGKDRSWAVGENTGADIQAPDHWFGEPDVKLVRLSAQDVVRAHAWSEGNLAFTGQTFGEAAEEFARYSRLRIRITDPDLAAEPIVGLFAMNDPVAFARIVAMSFDASVIQRGDEVIVAR